MVQALFLTMQNMIVFIYWREIAKIEYCKALHVVTVQEWNIQQENGQKLCTSDK